jgi:hypothetical protein
MIQAGVDGIIDFREARSQDPQWWRRCVWLMRAMERQNEFKRLSAAFQLTLTQLGNTRLTSDSYAKLQEAATTCFYDLVGTLKPWEGKDYEDRKKNEFADYRQRYVDAFGVDPVDEKFKAWEAEQVEKMLSGELDEETDTPDTEEILNKRLQERINRGR